MDTNTALRALAQKGKPDTVQIYRRHGVSGPCWGVSYDDLGKLVRQCPVDQDLARGLWRSGVHDARVLATKVADPARATAAEVEGWLRGADNYILVDALSGVAARLPTPAALMRRWIEDGSEWVSAAGWNVAAILATDRALDAVEVSGLLRRIQRGIHSAPNRTRHAMNNALIAIGGAMPEMRSEALAVANAIGRVEVDHGETGCQTPDAAGYIARMVARAAARTRVTGARMPASRRPRAKARSKAAPRKAAKRGGRRPGGRKKARKKARR